MSYALFLIKEPVFLQRVP